MGVPHTGPVFGGPAFLPTSGDDPATVSGHRVAARLVGRFEGTPDEASGAASGTSTAFGGRSGTASGGGALGRVYLAYAPGGQPVALTVIREEAAGRPDFGPRFHQDAEAAGRVRGPYVVPVVGSGKEGSRYWFATAYVASVSLRDAVAGGGPLPTGVVLRLVAGLAEGLQSLHHAGVVHGDLRPSHVLLAADGPRLKQYGFAGLGEGPTGAFLGPEQAAGRAAVAATDVFALGQIAAYAAIGAAPFGDGAKVRQDEPDLSELPGELREIVTRCLIKDPALRPSLAQITTMCAQIAPASTQPLALPWLPPHLLSALASAPGFPAGPGAAGESAQGTPPSTTPLPGTPVAPPPPSFAPAPGTPGAPLLPQAPTASVPGPGGYFAPPVPGVSGPGPGPAATGPASVPGFPAGSGPGAAAMPQAPITGSGGGTFGSSQGLAGASEAGAGGAAAMAQGPVTGSGGGTFGGPRAPGAGSGGAFAGAESAYPHPAGGKARRRGGVVGLAVVAAGVIAGVALAGGFDGGGRDVRGRVPSGAPTAAHPAPVRPPAGRPPGGGGGGAGATGSAETPGETVYRDVRLPAGYGLSLRDDPPTALSGTYSGDLGFTDQADAFAVDAHHGTLALAAPADPADPTGPAAPEICTSAATAQVASVPRRSVTTGTRLCVRSIDGTVALVTFRQLTPPGAPQEYATVDLTVWRLTGRSAESDQ
ncbi:MULTISPECIES: serine/threonine-protein kinase [unclassified Streptomyces]|uniref:serine/threonine-protein kinase n=1 Tax=unclassified Streptomyces TaxID=2593676 RepID=UPI002E2C8615|nr:serine/threonine-protein kinase [Streptomyces sp. NBC_00223]